MKNKKSRKREEPKEAEEAEEEEDFSFDSDDFEDDEDDQFGEEDEVRIVEKPFPSDKYGSRLTDLAWAWLGCVEALEGERSGR